MDKYSNQPLRKRWFCPPVKIDGMNYHRYSYRVYTFYNTDEPLLCKSIKTYFNPKHANQKECVYFDVKAKSARRAMLKAIHYRIYWESTQGRYRYPDQIKR